LVNNNNKKEREEIEFLKRELIKAQEEAKARDAKQKATIDRLNKQVEELRLKNKEQQDELKHVVDQMRSQQQQQRPVTAASDKQNLSH
jgi:uncharacterized coiled-coil protein SlyX